ncbi:hypothetical protein C9374_006379 [Naegleria lovaniensis]|uniref:E2 ubiquitin-conjugating enzyme n=1 Tax=Naegleria lovaniensis TaxID=51637 RepID=A0AA88GNW6_NAELO|nr:uncharacterized protein C9374_006379 [Naegleria lovaniensis]KAG2381390.1 hypothetical protein C9374_006379 [Naegleria lovaniensis]
MSSQASVMRLTRMKGELQLLTNQPPHGIAAYPKSEDSIDVLEAKIQGTQGTPYENGEFVLEITIPDRYPTLPPNVRFITRIYHPNIDSGGRICLDLLNMPPKGGWKPSINLSTLLASIKLLMDEPNGDDGLMADITEQFRNNRPLFEKTARDWTKKYAQTNHDEQPSSIFTLQHESSVHATSTEFSNNTHHSTKKSSKEAKVRKVSEDSSDSSSSEDDSDSEEESSKKTTKQKKRKL